MTSLEKMHGPLEEQERLTQRVGKKWSDLGGSIMGAGVKMSAFVTLPVLAGLGLSVKAASDLEETMNKVNVVFGDASGSVLKFMDDAATSLGMSKQQAGEAAATFGNLLSGTGKSKDEVAKMSENLVQLASDMSSFNNIPMADALEKIRSGLVGEAEPLRTVGVLLDDATLRQKALTMGLVSNTTDALSPNVKMLASYALILDKTKAQQGDFARTSDGLANSTRTATAELKDLAASFGKDLIPMAKDALGIIKPLMGVLNGMPGPVRKIVIGFGLLAAVAGPLAVATGGVMQVYGGLVTNLPKVATGAKDAYKWFKNTSTLMPTLTPSLAANALQWGAVGLAAGATAIAIMQAYDAAMKYKDALDQLKTATEGAQATLDMNASKLDPAFVAQQQAAITADSKVNTPWYYYLNPAYAFGEPGAAGGAWDLLQKIFFFGSPPPKAASGGTIKAFPGGTIIRAAEAGEDEDFVPASKRKSYARRVLGTGAAAALTLHVTVTGNTFVGTSRDAERTITDMVVRNLGPRVDRLQRGRFAPA